MAPKQTKFVSRTTCAPKNHETILSQSKLIRSIRFFWYMNFLRVRKIFLIGAPIFL